MAFFQNSVLNKHLKALDKEVVNAAYTKFKKYFHNPEIQQNIHDAREEQFQEGFLRELFVNILGYSLNPQPNYNLTTELKNEKGAQKADGAILQDGKALAVIELKGTDTKDLDKINNQAFNYKNNQSGCIYVITSNFEKLRFFIHNAVDHLEFNLFTLTAQEFELLWLCLRADNLLGNVPLKVKEESLLADENITKQLYKDYSNFKNELWQNMVKNHPGNDQLLLYKKTQKLLDRFLFIFFAEDSGLLPPNSISRIVERWKILKEEDAYKPLYEIFKQYFGYINIGRKGKSSQDDIFAYNGGLFFPDLMLDNIVIDDNLLHKHVMKLTAYYFQSEVDVNILGHIFENSLNEIENVIARLEGREVDKSKTKRKKDGVYYTPKYITKYIVENTVGKLCEEKKAELGVIDEKYAKGRRNRNKETIKKLDTGLKAYREWLLNITICDPACGSGAFLNQALEFLIEEHAYVDELYAQLHGASIVFQDVSNHILEMNIYGVDINEESIDIAQLSLWLRTAQRGRKLTTLNNNLKCGNSLIDDPAVAGEKAFNWQNEFPDVFTEKTLPDGTLVKSGFDVVIGNPPYGADFKIEEVDYFSDRFDIGDSTKESYAIFFEKSFQLVRNKGLLSFITPDTLLRKQEFRQLRELILFGKSIKQLIETGPVFKDARDTWCLISVIKNQTNFNLNNKITHRRLSRYIISVEERLAKFGSNHWENDSIVSQKIWENKPSYVIGYLSNEKQQKIIDKLNSLVKLGDNPRFSISRGEEGSKGKFSNQINGDFFFVTPEEVSKYCCKSGWTIYSDNLSTNKLENFYSGPKIWIIRIQKMRWHQRIVAAFDGRRNSASLKTLQVIVSNDNNKHLLRMLQAILNSRIINFWCVNFLSDDNNSAYLRNIPIPELTAKHPINNLVQNIESFTADFYNTIEGFSSLVVNKLGINKVTRNLLNWDEFEFIEFLKELKKAKVQLSLSEEAEWMQYFGEQKQKAQELISEINRIDKEIDQMVYKWYGLTEEEIKIVEGS